jgi:WD40 repeat protein
VAAFSDGPIYIWDLQKRKGQVCFLGQHPGVRSLAFSPDGRTLAAVTPEVSMSLWDVAGGEWRKFPMTEVWSVAFSPDGRTLAVAGNKGITLCDPSTCQVRTTLPSSARTGCITFSPDGKRLVGGAWHRTDALKMWDLPGDKEPVVLRGHTGPVTAARFTPDGRTILSASKDATVKFWDVAARLELFTLRHHRASVDALEMSADGQLLLSSSEDGSVRLWRAPRETPAR